MHFDKGVFTNYIDKSLALFDHLPPCVDIFYLISQHFWTTHKPLLVNLVCERSPTSRRIVKLWYKTLCQNLTSMSRFDSCHNVTCCNELAWVIWNLLVFLLFCPIALLCFALVHLSKGSKPLDGTTYNQKISNGLNFRSIKFGLLIFGWRTFQRCIGFLRGRNRHGFWTPTWKRSPCWWRHRRPAVSPIIPMRNI